MISTAHRVQHACGYIALGLLAEAAEELELIDGEDRLSAEVMSVRTDLYLAAKNWDLLLAVARKLASLEPEDENGWIYWAYALRELNRTAEARAVLLHAETLLKSSSTLQFNLGCYECILGDIPEARRRVGIACKMDPQWKQAALTDPDLKAMWESPPSA